MPKTPIAFFAYKRPWHTEQALESLSRCEGAEESELFIFCDGPKRPEDARAVEEVRNLVKSRKWCGTVNVIERDKNLGLANSIIRGVTDICERYGRVIVLEDDLVLSPYFLDFMNEALDIYKDIPRVMHISGYMFPVKGNLPETFFYRATSSWGWATWKRAWEHFEPDAGFLLEKIRQEGLERKFTFNRPQPDFLKMLESQKKGLINSWAIRWYASVFIKGGLVLSPHRSLVRNIGHDGTGTHCGITSIYETSLNQERISHFPSSIKEDKDVADIITDYFKGISPSSSCFRKTGTWFGRILRRAINLYQL